jgi:hypothetical protein
MAMRTSSPGNTVMWLTREVACAVPCQLKAVQPLLAPLSGRWSVALFSA